MVSVTFPKVDTYPVGSQTHRGASLEFWYQHVWHFSAQLPEDNATAQYGVSRSMMYNGLRTRDLRRSPVSKATNEIRIYSRKSLLYSFEVGGFIWMPMPSGFFLHKTSLLCVS
jgi:hypothetical protein